MFIGLAAILLGAKLAAAVSRRIGLPGVFGEILVGVVLGPSLLGWIQATAPVLAMAEIGALVLLFIAGMETDLVQVRQVGVPSSLAAAGGVVLPFAGGVALAQAFSMDIAASLFLGAILTATSVSISAQTLQELGKLRTREGTAILSAAIIDDVLGVIVLSLVVGLGGGGPDGMFSLVKMVLFFPAAILLGERLFPAVAGRFSLIEPKEARLAIALAMVLAYAWAAQQLGGMAAITGAYLAGVLMARTHARQETLDGVAALAYGFFVPVFFVGIGLQADIRGFLLSPVFAGLLLVIAVLGKVAGCFLGAWAGRFTAVESFRVGVGMISRGEVALVIAAIGLHSGVIDDTMFASTVAMALVTTVVTPPLLKGVYALTAQRGAAGRETASLSAVEQLAQAEEMVAITLPGEGARH